MYVRVYRAGVYVYGVYTGVYTGVPFIKLGFRLLFAAFTPFDAAFRPVLRRFAPFRGVGAGKSFVHARSV